MNVKIFTMIFYVMLCTVALCAAKGLEKEEVDKVIEDEITQKLSEDLLQSIEKKFQVDLEKSVDNVLSKIKLLLQNGTTHIQDKLAGIQGLMDTIQRDSETQVETCLVAKQNLTGALAEKALHQMVVCGYALIGHDPAQAVTHVMAMKNMIKQGLKPLYEQKKEVYGILKVCGHDHDTLKKVIKCVISKSPLIKSAMMDVTNKLIEGVVELTKQMAHGAMHEACLIEVLKMIEDEAYVLISDIKTCVESNSTITEEANKYLKENNATVIDIKRNETIKEKADDKKELLEMKKLLRRMLEEKEEKFDKKFKKEFMKLKKNIDAGDTNDLENDLEDNDL